LEFASSQLLIESGLISHFAPFFTPPPNSRELKSEGEGARVIIIIIVVVVVVVVVVGAEENSNSGAFHTQNTGFIREYAHMPRTRTRTRGAREGSRAGSLAA